MNILKVTIIWQITTMQLPNELNSFSIRLGSRSKIIKRHIDVDHLLE